MELIEKKRGVSRIRLAISDEKGHRSFNLYMSKTIKELGIKEGNTLTMIGSYCSCCGPFRIETIENADIKQYKRGINLVCLCSKCLKKGVFIYGPELEINKKYNLSDFKIQCQFCKNQFDLKDEKL